MNKVMLVIKVYTAALSARWSFGKQMQANQPHLLNIYSPGTLCIYVLPIMFPAQHAWVLTNLQLQNLDSKSSWSSSQQCFTIFFYCGHPSLFLRLPTIAITKSAL